MHELLCFAYRRSLIHFSLGTPILRLLYEMPLIGSAAGLADASFKYLAVVRSKRNAWGGRLTVSICSPPIVHSRSRPRVMVGRVGI